MWKYTVTYEDFDGNEKKRDLLFNLTKAELRKLNYSLNGGIDKYYQQIIDSKNTKELYDSFESVIKLSYGRKSIDGEHFEKSDEIFNEFKSSMAYDSFMDYLLETEDGAVKFINGIIPKSVANEINKK